MKFPQILLCSICLLITDSSLTAAPGELQQLLTEGQAAYQKGDLATAKMDFDWVIRMDPHNKAAIGYLRMIAAQEGQRSKGGGAQEKALSGLMIPKLEFKDATLGSALDYMKKAAEKISEGKVAVSFVVQLPQEQVNTQTITLSLANVPYTEALRYIGDLASLKFTYEKYAIRVEPRTGGAAAAAAPAGAAPPAAK